MSDWQGFYTTAQVSRIARIPTRTLNDWRERGIISQGVEVVNHRGEVVDHGFSYAQLTIIKIMRALREDALDLRSVRVALMHLFERLGPPSKGWADAHVYIIGNKIFAETPDQWEVTAATRGGQKTATVLFGDMFQELRDLDEPGAILVPEDYRTSVRIDPRIMGGLPVVRDTRIPTSMLTMLREKGKSVAEIARLYQLSREAN